MRNKLFAGILSVLSVAAVATAATAGCGVLIDDVNFGYNRALREWLASRDPDTEIGFADCEAELMWGAAETFTGIDTSNLPTKFVGKRFLTAAEALAALKRDPATYLLDTLADFAFGVETSPEALVDVLDIKTKLVDDLRKRGFSEKEIGKLLENVELDMNTAHCGFWLKDFVPDHLASPEDWEKHNATQRTPTFCPLGDEGCPDSPVPGSTGSTPPPGVATSSARGNTSPGPKRGLGEDT